MKFHNFQVYFSFTTNIRPVLIIILLCLHLNPLFTEVSGSSPTICDVCLKNENDTPFYCAIKPDLPQCIFPTCPKICEMIENDPTLRNKAPPAPPPHRPPPHPSYLPRVPKQMSSKFAMGRSMDGTPQKSKKKSSRKYFSLGRTIQIKTFPSDIKPYNPTTCELMSPDLRRIRPDSKYIEYRPAEETYQIRDIYKIAEMSGLAMAEFHHPLEWWAVEMSSVSQIVSTYSLTAENPRIYYAIGMKEVGVYDKFVKSTQFKYVSNNQSVVFSMLDPRVFGRTDEQCAVLSHVTGNDKRQYLSSRLFNCNLNMGDGTRIAHGLFMYPPGSLCYRRSEEECGLLKQIQAGEDEKFHSLIQIGQTLRRFIYLYTDQQIWEDGQEFCQSRGLRFFDLDPAWDDALRTAEVIEHFLREGKLNPTMMFWTSGRFENKFSDGKFRWSSTNTFLNTQYKTSAPPFPFAWWDDQDFALDEVKGNPNLHRRNTINDPCVALALNPQDGGDRPKLNFKAWYCNFPLSFLCYKELVAQDKLDEQTPFPKSNLSRSPPSTDSCDGPPEAAESQIEFAKNGENSDDKKGQKLDDDSDDLLPETIDPFDKESCSSKSLTAKRIMPSSKYVAYQPRVNFYSVEEIKEQCKKFGLIPGEIRTREDWDSIAKSGIGGIASNIENRTTHYFYVIGMDDTKELGKLRYASDDGELTFAMFTTDGVTDISDRCSVIESVTDPSGKVRGLAMEHVNCKTGVNLNDKVAYGLCMFPREWSCYTDSNEETVASLDTAKFTTIIPLGVTDTRSIFFNPVQRNWDEATKFCESANLKLLDFDEEEWKDAKQVMRIFNAKLVKDGGFFQLTPIWTSGKLSGFYKNTTGSWTSSNTAIEPSLPSGIEWLHLSEPSLELIREGIIENGCLEGTFDEGRSVIRLRPDYCDIPKYFFCYRKSNRRNDPEPKNTLGITMIIEEGDDDDGDDDKDNDKATENGDNQAAIELVSSGSAENETFSASPSGPSGTDDGDDDDGGFFIEKNDNNFVPFNEKTLMTNVSQQSNQETQFDEVQPAAVDDEDDDDDDEG